MSTATKSFDKRYFINVCRPQRGTATPQHMWDVPQFSQQHMYVCICMCVCDINTSEGGFHRVLSGGALTGII